MLRTCLSCSGFLPPATSTCPHCGAHSSTDKGSRRGRALVQSLLAVASGGAMAVTLMACYGAPPCDGPDCGPSDNDGDGYYEDEDCNDSDPTIHPDADDPRDDGIDQNCDGEDGVKGSGGSGGAGGSGAGGAGGGGGAGGASSCSSCAAALGDPSLDPAGLCASSKMLYEAFKACACQQSCNTECNDNLCAAMPISTACDVCVQANCNTEHSACAADK